MIMLPSPILPSRSAASIMALPIRVFDARKGIKEFAFDIDVGIQTGSRVIDFNERGVTHGISDRFEFFAHT